MGIILNKMFVLLQAANDTVIGGAVQDVSGEMKTSFWQMFNYGGWIMYLLLAMSIIAIYIFVERLLVINKAGKFDKDFMCKIRSYIYNGDLAIVQRVILTRLLKQLPMWNLHLLIRMWLWWE